jgi:uncharacterized protein (TIGR02217 family)
VSSLVYPTLPGLKFDSVRTPLWRTRVEEAVSGKETRMAYRQFPRIRFELQYEILRDYIAPSELKALVGLFNAMQGRFDTFLFTDPNFNAVVAEPIGTGTGSALAFQLVARYQNSGGPGIPELVQNLNGAPAIFVGGVLQTAITNYNIGPTGIVTFTSPPANAAAITWSGSFYYRCRFEDDEMPVTEFLRRFWRTKTVSFVSVKL